MSQAIEIIQKLETGFSKEQSMILADVILEQEETYHSNLVTKDYLHKEITALRQEMNQQGSELRQEINQLGSELRQEMSELRKEMNDRFKEMDNRFHDKLFDIQKSILDVQKSVIDIQKSVIDVQKSITRMTVYFISAIGTIAIILKVLDIVFK